MEIDPYLTQIVENEFLGDKRLSNLNVMIVTPVMGYLFQKLRILMKAKEFNYSVGFDLYNVLK